MSAAPKIFALGTFILFTGCVVDTPQPTIADGVYDLDPGACEATVSETRLKISGDQFKFYESSCQLQSEPGGSGGLKARLICTGEGQEWERQVTLQSSPDLLTINEENQLFRYHRCS